jgi:glutathione S-transferase
MALVLHQHPLASFCWKVTIALRELGVPYVSRLVDFGEPDSRDDVLDLWPVGKIPILHDEERGRVIPESSVIIEYADIHRPGASRLLPEDPDERLDARLWDRFFDFHVHIPMQTIVLDRIRPEGAQDPFGVAAARRSLGAAYDLLERRMADRDHPAGHAFSLADCAAFPALFYATIVEPPPQGSGAIRRYLDRLSARPSVVATLDDARPYFPMFPYAELIPPQVLRP